MRSLALILSLMTLTGCEEHFRYPCQNPENFAKAECQRPKCLFTQQCSDYLVAPVLEKQVVQQPTAPASTDSR